MLNSSFYRSQIADPGVPTAILSLSELEHAIGAAHVGDPEGLFARLTDWSPNGIGVPEAIAAHEASLGVSKARNPLLDAAYDDTWGSIGRETGAAA